MKSRWLAVGLAVMVLGAVPVAVVWAQAASADSSVAPAGDVDAPADSSASGLTGLLMANQLQADQQQPAAGGPLVVSWDREPKANISAKIRLVSYSGDFNSTMVLDKGANLAKKASFSLEEYRKQDKTVEKRDGSLSYRSGTSLPVDANLRMNWNWSEDRTVNLAGKSNVNKRDFKQAHLGFTKSDLVTGPVTHSVALSGAIDDQRGENQRQKNDFSEGKIGGAVRSKFEPLEDLAVATSVYRQHSAGDRALGDLTSPSSSDIDSLTGGVFWKRGIWQGSFAIKQASFNKRYLDYNRNANNLIDTVSPGVQKVVEEMERKDAVSLQWGNKLRLGRLGLGANFAQDMDEHRFQASGAGKKEKEQDHMDLDLSFRYARKDSFTLSYGYLWQWDDQTYKGASISRGRQINKRRDLDFTLIHRAFENTAVTIKHTTSLSQDIAEKEFNDNDRDRFETNSSIRVGTDWTGRFRTTMIFAYRHIEDISIRSNRSSNNNEKDTYELAPGYSWPLASWIELQQDFRLSIQFTNYVFSDLPSVSRQDDYNKRGDLKTRISFSPSQRLRLVVSHDYNARFNATRTLTDAAGNDFYSKDLEQRISTIDFALTYNATDWLKLESASYRTKDLKDAFGGAQVTTTDTRSGEVWLGGTVNKDFGKDGDIKLAASARRYHAFGPNVQEVNERYWDADISLSWKF